MKRCPKCGKQFPDEANFCPLDAGRLEPEVAPAAAPAPAAPSGADDYLGGRFKLGQLIGGGVTGQVHQAVERGSERRCVVKLVDPRVFPNNLLLQRSERELKQLEHVDAAGIARILGHGTEQQRLWVATEMVAGRPLDQIIGAEGPFDLERASGLVLAVGRALGEAARVGVVHRDLAPKNILVDGGEIKLINFGVAVPVTDQIQGVPEYVSPEQVEGKPVDQRSNIYSLGAICYFMLTGRPPYSGSPQAVFDQHLNATPLPPSTFAPGAGPVDAIVLKCLERASSRRFMTLRQFLDEVERTVFDAGSEGPGTTQRMGGVGKQKSSALGGTLMGGYSVVDDGKQTEAMETLPTSLSVPASPIAASPFSTAPGIAPAPGGNPAAHRADPLAPTYPPAEPPPPAYQPPVEPPPPAYQPPAAYQPSPAYQPPAAYQPMPAYQPPSPAYQPPAEPPPPAYQPPPEPERVAPAAAPTPAPAPAKNLVNPAASGSVTQDAGGKRGKQKKKSETQAKAKNKFRETMWFKKGALDAEVAQAAATDVARSGGLAADKVDELPIEDRYQDDGTIDERDKQSFSLQTGHTQSMPAVVGSVPQDVRSDNVSENDLISEMKGGRGKVIAALIAGVVLIAVVVVYFMTKQGDAKKPDPQEEVKPPVAQKVEAPAAPAPVPDGKSGLDALTAACRAKDGAAVWQLYTPELQVQTEAAAATARKLSAKKLKSDYGYTGKPAALEKGVYLSALIARGDAGSPCKGVDKWQVGSAEVRGARWVVTIDLGDGTQRDLDFAQDGEVWRLAAMTNPAKT